MRAKPRADYTHINASDEVKRLNRVIGQVEGIRKMLEEERQLKDVLMQCKAVRSALRSVEARLFKAHLDIALDEIGRLEKKKNRDDKIAELELLFKQAG